MNLSKKCGLFITFIIVLFSRIILPQEMVVTHCTGIDSNAFIRIEAPAIYTQLLSRGLLPENDFIVDYDASVTNEMVAAFNKATEIWSCYLQISKPVKIHVSREALDGNTLASTVTVTYRNNLPGLTANRQYPIALVKQLNSSIVYDGYDMTIAFTTTRAWECNLLGIPVADKYDFISTALHEIGHGLGFSSSMQIKNNVGRYGYKNFPVDTGKYVEPFDVPLLTGTDRLYLMTDSVALGTNLKSGNVVFDGANAKKANNENNAKMYAPSVWDDGSSICHLDDATYGFNNPSKIFLNAMMASATKTAAVIHDPGPITLGILKDIGWTVNRFIAFDEPLANKDFVKGQVVPVKWYDNTTFTNTSITLQLYQIVNNSYALPVANTVSGLPNLQATNPGRTGNVYNWTIPANLADGTYYLLALGYNPESDFGKSFLFNIGSTPERPLINPPTGIVPLQVALTCTTPGAQIRYTVDGTEPTASSTLYSSSLSISAACTLRTKSFFALPSGIMQPSLESKGFYIASLASEYSKDITITGEYFTKNSSNDWISGPGLGVGKDPDRNSSIPALRNRIQWTYSTNDVPKGVTVSRTELIIVLRPKNNNSRVSLKQHDYTGGMNDVIYEKLGTEPELVEFDPLEINTFQLPYLTNKVQQVVNAGSGTVAIGLQNKNESNSSYMLTGNCAVSCSTVVLRVYYLSNTEITQKDADGFQFGQVWLWENTAWQEKQVPYRGVYGVGTQITARAMQTEKDGTNQKYWTWLNQENVLNYQNLTVTSGNNQFVAYFQRTKKNIKIAPMVEGYSAPQVSGTNVNFTDPWLIDENVATYGNRNRGMNAIPYTKSAPMDFNNPGNANYLGVFANQGIGWFPPYYSIGFPQGQTFSLPGGSAGKAYFLNWYAVPASGAEFKFPNDANTPVIFKEDNTIVYANFKGTQTTSSATAYSNNSQRKLVNVGNGTLYLAYESMDRVWLEYSTDNGSTWTIANNGKPVSTNRSKSPSMDFYMAQGSSGIILVYQEEVAGNNSSRIKARYINLAVTKEPVTVFEDYCTGTYNNHDYQVVVAVSKTAEGLIVFKYPNVAGEYSGQLAVVPMGWMAQTPDEPIRVRGWEDVIPQSDALSITPAISAGKTSTENNFQLAWGQMPNTQGDNSNIHFLPMHLNTQGSPNTNDFVVVPDATKYRNLSEKGDYTKNTGPSIISVLNTDGFTTSARVVWNASRGVAPNSTTTTMFCDPANRSRFWSFGTWINSPTITLENDNKYFIGWANLISSTPQDYWVDNSLSAFQVKCIGNLNSRDMQITGMSSKTTARAIGLSGTTAPYSFAVKPLQTGNAVATEGTIVTTAIEGTVNYPDAGGVSFNYKLGDISVDGDPISFVEADPLIIFRTVEDMNQYLVSQPFTLNDRSEFFYSIECLPVQPEYVEGLFQDGSSLSFTVQLVDALTEEIIGTYDNVLFDATHTSDYRNIMFDVDCNGIGDRTVKLRLQITNTAIGGEVVQGSFIIPLPEGQTAKMMSKVKEDRISFWRNNGAVAKKTATIKKITFKGKAAKGADADAVITEYALDQNYPNPFNPVTTINYQLPKAGVVTLKIYDMLGKEVKVLVNEYKESGKYTAEFNGAGLASGVYVYRLDCNNYHASKKLTLLK